METIFQLFFLFLGLTVFLFCLYSVSKDDIVFLRKNVSLDQLFNLAIFCFLVGLLFARIEYIFFNFAPGFLNPLVFFLVPYFPGLSFFGGLVGAGIFLLAFTKRKKMPVGRIVDFFGLSLLAALPFGFISTLFLNPKIQLFQSIFLPVIYFMIFILFFRFVYPRTISSEIKNGTLGTSSVITISFVTLAVGIINNIDRGIFALSFEQIIPLSVFVSSVVVFIKQEFFIVKGKKQ